MTAQDWAGLILSILSILAFIVGGIKWMVKNYFKEMLLELKPNGGTSMKDAVVRLEINQNEDRELRKLMDKKLDNMYNVLLDHIQKTNK